jgi:hypothetical protein
VTGSEVRHHDHNIDAFLKAHDIAPGPAEVGELAPLVAIIEYTTRSALWAIYPPGEPVTPVVRRFGMIVLFTIADAFCQRFSMDDGSPVNRDEVVSHVAGNVIGTWPSEDPAWEEANITFRPTWLEGFHGGSLLWSRIDGYPRSYAALVELFDQVWIAFLHPENPEPFRGLPSLTLKLFEALNDET